VIEDAEEGAFLTLGPWDRPGPSRGVAALLHDAEGRVLMQLRDDRPGVAFAGWWTLFGGGVEPGETLRGAMAREFAEETGVTLDPAALTPFARVISTWGANRLRHYVFSAPAAFGPEGVRVGEGAGFAFMTPEQVAAHKVIPEIAFAVSRFVFARRTAVSPA
jgi:8-oxo-dGTP diphosphatase